MQRKDAKDELGSGSKGNWKQFKGKVQQQWGALTDDDLDKIEGRQEELAGLHPEALRQVARTKPKPRDRRVAGARN